VSLWALSTVSLASLSRRTPRRTKPRLQGPPLCPSTCHPLSAILRRDSHRPASSVLEPRKSKVFHLACGPPPDSEESLGRALPTFPPSASQIAGTGPTLHPKIQAGWGAGPVLKMCKIRSNLSLRLKEPLLEIATDSYTPIGRSNLRNQPTRDAEEPLIDLSRSFQLPTTQPCLSMITTRVSKDSNSHHFHTQTKPELAPQRTALLWGFSPYDVSRRGQRPTLGLPHLAALRLQVFSTS
jgi:hypothetical protein